jgi:hypothetical protein
VLLFLLQFFPETPDHVADVLRTKRDNVGSSDHGDASAVDDPGEDRVARNEYFRASHFVHLAALAGQEVNRGDRASGLDRAGRID